MVQQADRSAAAIKALLDAARALFARHGYAAVSIDQIAQRAGYAKGAFYHHFGSKQEVFEQVLDGIQAQLAQRVARRAQAAAADPSAPPVPLPRLIADNILAYLEGAIQPRARRILLIDGPMVLGWQRWREIDDKYFADAVRNGVTNLLGAGAGAVQVDSATRLVLGATMEAALSCGMADDPAPMARAHGDSFELLLSGLQRAAPSGMS